MAQGTPIPECDRTHVLSERAELDLRFFAEQKGVDTTQALEEIMIEYAMQYLDDEDEDEDDE